MNTFPKRILVLFALLWLSAAAVAQEADKKPAAPTNTEVVTQETDKKPASPPAANATVAPTAPATAEDADTKTSANYKIGPGDVLAIAVWKEPDLSEKVPVRPDGMITLPLIGDVKAAGSTPIELQSVISEKLKAFVSTPAVTVIVDEVRSHVFNVLGQVLKPGSYPLAGRTTVLEGIAQAGGFKALAKTKKIYVMRTGPDGKVQKLPFNYNEVIKGQHEDENVQLQSHDTIVVP